MFSYFIWWPTTPHNFGFIRAVGKKKTSGLYTVILPPRKGMINQRTTLPYLVTLRYLTVFCCRSLHTCDKMYYTTHHRHMQRGAKS